MKKYIKNIKLKIKSNLLVKLAQARKDTRTFKEKLAEEVLKNQKLIDEITILKIKNRELTLKAKE